MLVLSRRYGEEIVIDGNIRLTVVQIEGGKVRLGVVAPTKVGVRRNEVSGDGPSGIARAAGRGVGLAAIEQV